MSRAELTAVADGVQWQPVERREELHTAEQAGQARARLLVAAVEAVTEVGYRRVTVAHVISRANVSRGAFEESIAGLEPLLCAAYRSQARWQDGIREALAELLVVFDREPAIATLCIVEALSAGEPALLHRRSELLAVLAAVVDRGRRRDDAAGAPADLAAEGVAAAPADLTAAGVVGAVVSLLHERLLQVPRQPLAGMLGQLMSIVVLPYQGQRAARRELARPPRPPRPPEQPHVAPPRRGALREQRRVAPAQMLLTYRTLRVLDAIAQRPGASNREIAAAAGIADEGQCSKLMGRLKRLELVRNGGGGAANAWLLSQRGEQVLEACRSRIA